MSETTTDQLSGAVSLAEFLRTHDIGGLTVDERRLIVQQALLILEQNYALLPFKVARYGINPLQRLRLLQQRLGRPGPLEPEWRFHAELVDIFNSLHDLHTRYVLPTPFAGAAASLPFLLKEFTEDGRARYLVGRRAANQAEIAHPSFRFGVEITHWNGVPIDRTVERLADRLPGANPDARHARAVEMFTVRALAFGPPPDEDWITVSYVDAEGEDRRIDLVWSAPLVDAVLGAGGSGGGGSGGGSGSGNGDGGAGPLGEVAFGDAAGADHGPPPATDGVAPDLGQGLGREIALGLDVEGEHIARLRTLLFAPEFVEAEQSGAPVTAGPDDIDVAPDMATVFEARRVTVGGRRLGHLRIRRFRLPAEPASSGEGRIRAFVREFIRLLGELPQDGLVLDIRGNPGGAILASELCLQALTARPVEPEPAQLAATTLNLRICRANPAMRPWLPSMEQALESGAPHSAAIPFTPAEFLAEVPQAYFGPVVLVTDARCYSAADIFSAGFQDNGIGPILGIHGNTGAGGGNIWYLADLLGSLPQSEDFPFRPLPDGADLSLVIRRLLRVGPNAGTPLEDYGVVPDRRHVMTRDDVLGDEPDLMAAAAALLDEGVARRFDVALSEVDGDVTASFGVLGIDRADVAVDGRTRLTVDLGGNPGPVVVPDAGGARSVRVTGYAPVDGPDGSVPTEVAVRTFHRRAGTLQLLATMDP